MAGQPGISLEQPGQVREEHRPRQGQVRLGGQSNPVLRREVGHDQRPLLEHGKDGQTFAFTAAFRVEVRRELVPLEEARERVLGAATVLGGFGCSVSVWMAA